jgi:hypothetical protein
VGILDKLPTYKPREKEVAEVIEVPLVHMLDSRNTIREIWKLNNRKVKVPFYLYKNHKIWGATAMVLAELLDVIRSLDINS